MLKLLTSVLCVAGLFFPRSLLAQPNQTTPTLAWLTAGMGASSIGIAGRVGIGLESRGWTYSTRLSVNSHASFFTTGDQIVDAGILFGRALRTPTRGDRTLIWFAGGVGAVRRSFAPDPTGPNLTRMQQWSIGVPIEAQICMGDMPSLGACLHPFVNLNVKRMFGGLILGFAFGSVR